MNKGLFDLSGFEEKADDEILQTNLNEGSAEFDTKCPSVNPTQHFDAANSGTHTIPVPGGDKETPTAKPDGGEYGPTPPGGNKETPNAKPWDNASIPVPGQVTLTADTYNSALDQLQKSFKEGYEILGMLRQATVIEESVRDRQEDYNEKMFGEAMLMAYEDGPYFEKVSRSDKGDVKKVVRKIRGKMEDALESDGVKFYKPHLLVRVLLGIDTAPAWQQIWSTRLWQVLGICHCEDGNIQGLCDRLTKKFADELGEYKILSMRTVPALYDCFKLKFGWKNQKNVYFLLVDKKLDSELQKAQKEIADQLKASKKDDDKAMGESTKCKDCDDPECDGECKDGKKKKKEDDDE